MQPMPAGYLEAPGACDSPLGIPPLNRRPLGSVTLVFCAIDGLAAMQACADS